MHSTRGATIRTSVGLHALQKMAACSLAILAGCGPAVSSGAPGGNAPEPSNGAQQRGQGNSVLDPLPMYRDAGLIVAGPPLPFIGSVRFLASSTPESTLTLVTLSFANRALAFTNEGQTQRAVYGASIDIKQGPATIKRLDVRQTVRVSTFREATRTDESVIYEHFFMLPPGRYLLSVAIRDEGSANAGSQSATITVPRFSPGTLSTPIPVYQVTPRTRLDTVPSLITNPRAAAVLGRDTLAPIYLEGYGLSPSSRIVVAVLSDKKNLILEDTIRIAQHGPMSSARLDFPVGRIGIGRLSMIASLVGSVDTVETPLLITISEDFAITSFDELLSYLRFYATPERLQVLRDAPPDKRAAAWAAFWKATDPNPATPEHEGLRDYFLRIRQANQRFGEEGGPGWLTDRGKVFVTLGEPDQVLEQQRSQTDTRGRAQGWDYSQFHVQFVFVDQTGFNRWRLTAQSQADFDRISRQEMVH